MRNTKPLWRWSWVLVVFLGVANAGRPQVALLDSSDHSFAVATGSVVVWYDSSHTDGLLFVARDTAETRVLASSLLGVKGANPLAGGVFEGLTVVPTDSAFVVQITSRLSWGRLRATLVFYRDAPGLFRWTVRAVAEADFSPWRQQRECFFWDRSSKRQFSVSQTVYARQAPWAAGVAYFFESDVLGGTLLFFENFTEINRYFELYGGGPRDAIYLSNRQFGFVRPVSANLPLPKGEEVTLEDSFIFLVPGEPRNANEVGERFLVGLSQVLQRVERPAVSREIDWLGIAKATISALEDRRAWVEIDNSRFLRAYVDVPRFQSAEAIAQLDVLTSLRDLEQSAANPDLWRWDELYLVPNLLGFVQPTYRVFVNDYPAGGVTGGNGWYELQLLLDLAHLAKSGGTGADLAKSLLLQSLPTVVNLARANNRRFFEQFRFGTYEVGGKLEPDATGGYAYLMLDAFELFGDSTYLYEAEQALVTLPLEEGFDFAYEVHFSAITAAACARLAGLKGEHEWLDKSALPLAALMRLVWWWECDYGYAKQYQTFGGLSPMIGAGVITPKEQYEAWRYLREFVDLAGDELPPDVVWLVKLFLDQTPAVCYFTLPPHLPREAVWLEPTIYSSRNDPDLMIPLEDLREGWERSGQYGQEIYGAGMPLAFAAVQVATGVRGESRSVPHGLELTAFPNPSKDACRIKVPGDVAQVEVVDVKGRVVRRWTQVPGSGIVWDGADAAGNPVASGVYLVVAKSQGRRWLGKVLLLR